MTTRIRSEAGFTLAELLIATALLLVVSSIVTQALMQMTNQQQTIWNRTEMHSGVRGATELMQQEVGQAGRIAIPNKIKSSIVTGFDPTTISTCQELPVTLSCIGACVPDSSGNPGSPTDGLWYDAPTNASILLTWLDGDNTETVRVDSLNRATNQITACFWENHLANAPVVVRGAFASGVVPESPPAALPPGQGSDRNHLRLYGDINGDGHMVYIEYICDNGDIPGRPEGVASNNLYRNVMAFDTPAASKPVVTNSMILLSNVHQNPPDAGGTPRPCFQYQYPNPVFIKVQGVQTTFVLDVAVTLTVWTQSKDAVTKQVQTETKALLSVAPRNVFFAWELAGVGYTDHVQSMPATVAALLAVAQTP